MLIAQSNPVSRSNIDHTNIANIRVLIIDDQLDLLVNIFGYLEHKNFILDAAQDGQTGLTLALNQKYDVVVLDWMLPKLNGRDVLQHLRAKACDVPILMLTAKHEIEDKLSCFKLGADDYLTKPFSIAELEARIIALYQRHVGRQQILKIADLSYNLLTDTVTRAGQVLHIQSGGKKLLGILMKESPSVVSKDRLESLLWGEDLPDKDLLRTHIYELRKRIDSQFPVKLIHTIPRVGYQLYSALEPACSF